MSELHPDDLNAVIQRYQRRITEHGPTHASMASGGPQKQRARHAVHASALFGERPHLLDIGCGLGEFYAFLRDSGRAVHYVGYDVVPEYIAECRRLYSECHFEQRNIFTEGIGGQYDTIVMSQVLNNRYRHSDNMRVLQTALTLAFQHTRVSVSVDMMSDNVDYRNEDLYYYSPEAVFSFARTLTRRVILRHDYRPFEFTIQLLHQSAPGYVP